MKKCTCGKTFKTIPKDAKFAPDAVLGGYYFNCDVCHSTLVVPVEDARFADFKKPISFLYALVILLALGCFFLTGCAKDAGFQYCPAGETLGAATGDPTVLVIGDSISIGYTPTIKNTLTNYDVVHNPCNAMTSTWTKSQVDFWLASRPSFEAITWNNGLWDVADWGPTSDAEYVSNLHAIATKIKAKTAHPLFILTTEVLPGTPNRVDANVVHKNQLALAVMASESIPVLDLYSVSQTIQAEHVNPNDVHYTAAGSAVLGNAVLAELNNLYGIH